MIGEPGILVIEGLDNITLTNFPREREKQTYARARLALFSSYFYLSQYHSIQSHNRYQHEQLFFSNYLIYWWYFFQIEYQIFTGYCTYK